MYTHILVILLHDSILYIVYGVVVNCMFCTEQVNQQLKCLVHLLYGNVTEVRFVVLMILLIHGLVIATSVC